MSHMQRAVELAYEIMGSASPNPAVGAVLVKDGVEVGSGATQPPGRSHAEIIALNQASDQARGATLYTTLEPCCTWGRTPPCTQAIIAAGITEVHFAVIDPNPNVSGNGRNELEAAGIRVVLEEADGAKELYEAFAKHIKTGVPFITVKYAMTLDGKIVGINGKIETRMSLNINSGVGYAVPSNIAKRFLEPLKAAAGGEVPSGVLSGLEIRVLNENSAPGAQGVTIAGIQTESDASRIGLLPGDLILKVNDFTVRTAGRLQGILRTYPVGAPLKIELRRGGSELCIITEFRSPPQKK